VARAFREVCVALAPTEELDNVLDLLLDKTQELLECQRAMLYLLDESTGELVSRAVVGGQVRSIRMRVGFGIAGTVAQSGKTILVSDAVIDPRFEPQWDLLTGFTTRSMLATPLRNHLGSTIGVLQVVNKHRAGHFTNEDEALLVALSTQAAIVINNSRLVLRLKDKNRQLLETQQRLEQRVRELQLLFDIEHSSTQAGSTEELAAGVLAHIVAACDVQGAAILVAEDDSGDLTLFEYDSTRVGRPVRRAAKSGDGWLGKTMREGRICVIGPGDLVALPIETKFEFSVTSAIVAQLQGTEAPLGAIGLFGRRSTHPFGADDLELLRLLSSHVSTLLRLHRAATAR
jgi:GAF domain-containing protein